MELEVTLYACADNATLPTPDCEVQILTAVLEELIPSPAGQASWDTAGGAAAGWHELSYVSCNRN